MKLVEKYLDEDKLMDVYMKINKKDIAEIKSDIRKLESAMSKKDVIGIRSSSRAIESSARRITDRMGSI